MAIDFPSSPANGATYTYNGKVYTFDGVSWTVATSGGGGSSVTVSGTPPVSPSAGDMWFNSELGTLNVFFDDGSSTQWVAASGERGPVGVVGATGATGPTGATGAAGPTTINQVISSANRTTVLTDNGKHILHPSSDTTARTWTIDSNANVPYPIGAAITFVNQNNAGVITIAITADTLRMAGTGAVGNRTLSPNGSATALKLTAVEWIISGVGIS